MQNTTGWTKYGPMDENDNPEILVDRDKIPQHILQNIEYILDTYNIPLTDVNIAEFIIAQRRNWSL